MLLEYSHGKQFTSTTTSAWTDAYTAQEHTFMIETNAGSTCSFAIQHRMKNSTAFVVLSSGTMNASSATSYQFSGALYQVSVRMKTLTANSTTTARWFGN